MDGTPTFTDYHGLVLGMPEDDYHAHPAIGSTDVKAALRSLAYYRARRSVPPKDTPATRDGKILHCAILTPEVFERTHCIEPQNAPRDLRHLRNAAKPSDSTKESIAFWDQWDADHAGMTSISATDWDWYSRIRDCIRQHPELRPYFEAATDAAAEASVFARCPETGLRVKCRKDYKGALGGVRFTFDLKSTEDAREDAFVRNAEAYGYFISGAFYQDVAEWGGDPSDLFVLVAFEKPEHPEAYTPENFPLSVWEYDPAALEAGREKYRQGLALLKHAFETDTYPGYDTSIKVLRRPAWAR
jgi:exodeoxyribonuclease VIII